MEISCEPKLLDVMDKTLTVETGQKGVHKEPICMTRSDTMSIGSVGSTCSSSASIGGATEGMDTEDSERDIGGSSGRGSFSSVDGQQKQLNLDNEIKGYVPTGDLTSPVIENKLSDDLDGYFVMRTRLMSQSAVILENGAAFGNDRSPGFCDNENTNMEARMQSPGKCEDSSDDSEAETENREVFGNATRRQDVSTTQHNSNEGWNSPMVTKSSDSKDDNEELMNEDDPFRRRDNVSAVIKNEPMSDDECQGLLTSIPDGGDSSASESIAEVEKFGLNAKLARVSKRRIYSRARELSKASDSSSESDSDSESEEEDEEEEEKYEILDDIHEAKVLVNEAQPDSEKLIKREALKMACPDDLLSDYASSEDSSGDSSTDSSSGESSDSDDSSDLELSSVEESEEEERKPTNRRRNNADLAKDGLSQGLPKVEYLKIDLPDEVQLKKLGSVSSILGSLVIVQAEEKTPALNAETVLFKPDRTVLGQVFEVFGPVVSPFYSVRFNAPSDIEEHDIKLRTEAWFAPKEANVTQYVFTEQLKKLRGTDASWKNDEEVPDECADFSDDEFESNIRNRTNDRTNNKTKDRRRKVPQRRRDSGQDNWYQKQGQGQYQGNQRQNNPRSHPPLQRQHPSRPPHHHQGNQPWQQHPPPPGPPAFGGQGMMMRQSQSQPDFGSYQRSPRPRSFQSPQGMPSRHFPPMMSPQGMSSRHFTSGPPRPPGMPLEGTLSHPPMFQNPQAMGMPPPPFTPPQTPPQSFQQQPSPDAYQVGFSARKTENYGSWQRKTPDGNVTPNHGMFSARQTGILPPWQQMMSPWQQTPPPTPPPNSEMQPPPPGTLPPPPSSSTSTSSSSNHTNNPTSPMVTGPSTPSSSSGPFNVALFNLPPPPPPKPPSHLPLFHTNAPATPNTPLASAPLAFNQEQVNHMFSMMQQASSSPSVTMTTPSPLSLMQNPWQASTSSSPSPSFTTSTSSPQPLMQNLWQGSPAFSPSSPGFNQMSPSFAPPPVPPPSFHPRMMHSLRETGSAKGKKNSTRSTNQ